MIIVVESRPMVRDGIVSLFERAGVSAAGLAASDCRQWFQTAAFSERSAIEAVLVGASDGLTIPLRELAARSSAAIIAVNEDKSLAGTLKLFDIGFDDVVLQPLRVSEIMARIGAIRRRMRAPVAVAIAGDIRLFADGRDPEVAGQIVRLPRRERRILEALIANRGCWVSKTQLYNCVYGVFSETVPETAIESHVSRLRKRLRRCLGHDPISTQRYVGYRLDAA